MDFNYKKTRKHAIGKLVIMSLATLLPLILVGVFGIIADFFSSEQALDLQIFRYVVLVIFEAALIYKIVFYIRVIISEEWARSNYIKRRDERHLYIRQRTSSFTLKMILFVSAVGMIVTGFISKTAFYTLCGVVVVTVLTYIFTSLYFSKKI